MIKKKRVAWNKGKSWSEEIRNKISLSKKGNIPWNKGKKTGLIPKTAFVKGHIPWSKKVAGTGLMKAWNKGKRFPEKSGKNHFAWKGGISKGFRTGYYSADYKNWRITVFERDGYRCQGCGQVGGYLTVHHIKAFAKFPKLRFEINNGITLCEDCHKLTDNYKGKTRQKK